MPECKKNIFSNTGVEESALRLGMHWFIGSLAVFLVASVLAIIVIRVQVPVWPDLPPIPLTLWLSTGILVMSTFVMQKLKKGWNAIWLWGTIILVFLFLGLQIMAGIAWSEALHSFQQSEDIVAIARMALYVLIFLHGMHVVGGLVPLGLIATQKSYMKRQSLVPLLVLYWDFLCCIWILFFIVILVLQ